MSASQFQGATWEFSIAFNKGATDTVVDGDYTDVSKYVTFQPSTVRGRSSERDAFVVGQLSLVMYSEARIFDPDNASGTFFGKLLPMRHCRLRVTFNGSTRYVFKGYVAGWDQQWIDGGDMRGYVNLSCHDAFKVLAKAALPECAYAQEVKVDAPTAWYRLGDPITSTTAADSSGNAKTAYYNPAVQTASLTGGVVFATQDGSRTWTVPSSPPVTEPLESVLNTQGSGSAMGFVSGTTWSWEMWYRPPAVAAYGNSEGHSVWGQGVSGAPTFQFQFQQNFDGTRSIQLAVTDESAASLSPRFDSANSALTDGNSHHYVVTRSGTTIAFYIDGVAQTPAAGSLSGLGAATTNFGSSPQLWVKAKANGTTLCDEIAIYATQLSAARVLAHYTAGLNGFAGDTVSARISRVMAYTSYATFPTSIDTSTRTVQGCDFGGGQTKLLDYLQLLERTEGGQARLFIAQDGTLTFHASFHDTGNPTVAFAFTDAAGSTLPYTQTGTLEDNSTRLANDVLYQRQNGQVKRVADATSDQAYGTSSFALTGLLGQSDDEMLDRANAHLYRYKDPRSRLPSFTVEPAMSTQAATLVPAVQTIDIGAHVSVRKLPENQGSAWTREVTVEGISHQLDVGTGAWSVQYLLAPYDPANQWLVLDSATQGVLDTNRLGF